MGFFSDLKDDLSQAVNELMPEEELQAALENGEMPDISEETDDAEKIAMEMEKAQAPAAAPQKESAPTSDDLSDMLDRMEAISAESEVEEPVVEEPLMETPLAVEEPLMEEEEELVIPEMPAEESEPVIEAATEPIPEIESVEIPAAQAPETEIEKPSQETGREEKKMEMQGNATDETAVVTEGMSITGDITSGGSLELIGNVVGNIEVLGKLNVTGGIQGNSKAAEIFAEGARINGEINSGGSVKIGQSSVVIGNIFANSAVIAGAVKGDIDVHGPVVLDTSAIVMGNIKSKSVQINNGAVIEGMCSQCYADVNPTSFFEEIKKGKEKAKAK
ncbi:MAG: polymer-forming cytoskeletal protein [Ruminococcus sp.]|nr:polymer-forming cytoskeletal protein [Ruminococcus sp.]